VDNTVRHLLDSAGPLTWDKTCLVDKMSDIMVFSIVFGRSASELATKEKLCHIILWDIVAKCDGPIENQTQ